MFTPIGFFGGSGDLLPVLGYSAYIDFKDSPITLNGSNISQIDDLSGNGYHAVQTASADQPLWNTDGYYDGQQIQNNKALDWSLLDSLFMGRAFDTNNYEFVLACSEQAGDAQSFHPVSFADEVGGFAVKIITNSSTRRDVTFGGRGVNYQYATPSTSSDSVILYASSKSEPNTPQSSVNLFGHVNPLATSNIRTKSWIPQDATNSSRIGKNAEFTINDANNLNKGFRGRIYFCAVYPKILTPNQRIRIKNCAVNKWNLTHTQV